MFWDYQLIGSMAQRTTASGPFAESTDWTIIERGNALGSVLNRDSEGAAASCADFATEYRSIPSKQMGLKPWSWTIWCDIDHLKSGASFEKTNLHTSHVHKPSNLKSKMDRVAQAQADLNENGGWSCWEHVSYHQIDRVACIVPIDCRPFPCDIRCPRREFRSELSWAACWSGDLLHVTAYEVHSHNERSNH